MIKKATTADVPTLSELAFKLWGGRSVQYFLDEFADMVKDESAALFLCFDGEIAVGFAQCQLRHDYVEGTDSSPVGYLEGVYVEDSHRRKGVATRLLTACQQWAKQAGCTQFASDCELDNTDSLKFHLGVGFSEANRVICFVKELGD